MQALCVDDAQVVSGGSQLVLTLKFVMLICVMKTQSDNVTVHAFLGDICLFYQKKGTFNMKLLLKLAT